MLDCRDRYETIKSHHWTVFRETVYRLTGLGKESVQTGNRIATGHCTLSCQLHVMCLLNNAMCRKCGQEDKSSYHMFWQCSSLTQHRMKILRPEWLELKYGNRASVTQVLYLPLRTGLFWKALMETAQNGPTDGLGTSYDQRLSLPHVSTHYWSMKHQP
jgi:hypothetical protein